MSVGDGSSAVNGLAPYRRPLANTQPPDRFDAYVATRTRSPSQPLVPIAQSLSEVTGPIVRLEPAGAGARGDMSHRRAAPRWLAPPWGDGAAGAKGATYDLTAQGDSAPIGFRIIVHGRVLDEDARPVCNTLVEVWQANAAGRYRHKRDQWNAPLDPNFIGEGRTMTDDDGRYHFLTIRPGPYPWGNHANAWRPAHIHFSLFGNAYATRLVTQMYFPGDDMLPFDPIFNSIPDAGARDRLIARFDWERTESGFAHAFTFDIVLRGREGTPMEASGK